MGMEAAAPATTTAGLKKPPLPLPPALFLARARSRVADLDYGAAAAWPSSPGPPDTPPRRSPVTVPFLWEDAPGKPKAPPQGTDVGDAAPVTVIPSAAAADVTATPGRDHAAGEEAAPLKLPPRLQRVASATQQSQRDGGSLSPKAALHGPSYYYYYGCAGGKRPPPRRTASGLAAFRRAPSFGIGAGLFSRSSKNRDHLFSGAAAAAPDAAPWCSPAASSASSMSSSSSSLSASCFGDDHGHGGHRRPEDGSSEEEECASTGTVRITRFRRNRSFPSMTKSHLWASIRKSVKQIAPWS
ncbi:unnamed protein product [Urochloa humidicola]